MAVKLETHKVVPLTDLTIPQGNDVSNVLTADAFARYDALMIVGPGTLTGTVSLQVLNNASADETNDSSYAVLQSPPGTDITIAAGKAIVVTDLPAVAIRLISSGAESDDRVFTVFGLRAPH